MTKKAFWYDDKTTQTCERYEYKPKNKQIKKKGDDMFSHEVAREKKQNHTVTCIKHKSI